MWGLPTTCWFTKRKDRVSSLTSLNLIAAEMSSCRSTVFGGLRQFLSVHPHSLSADARRRSSWRQRQSANRDQAL